MKKNLVSVLRVLVVVLVLGVVPGYSESDPVPKHKDGDGGDGRPDVTIHGSESAYEFLTSELPKEKKIEFSIDWKNANGESIKAALETGQLDKLANWLKTVRAMHVNMDSCNGRGAGQLKDLLRRYVATIASGLSSNGRKSSFPIRSLHALTQAVEQVLAAQLDSADEDKKEIVKKQNELLVENLRKTNRLLAGKGAEKAEAADAALEEKFPTKDILDAVVDSTFQRGEGVAQARLESRKKLSTIVDEAKKELSEADESTAVCEFGPKGNSSPGPVADQNSPKKEEKPSTVSDAEKKRAEELKKQLEAAKQQAENAAGRFSKPPGPALGGNPPGDKKDQDDKGNKDGGAKEEDGDKGKKDDGGSGGGGGAGSGGTGANDPLFGNAGALAPGTDLQALQADFQNQLLQQDLLHQQELAQAQLAAQLAAAAQQQVPSVKTSSATPAPPSPPAIPPVIPPMDFGGGRGNNQGPYPPQLAQQAPLQPMMPPPPPAPASPMPVQKVEEEVREDRPDPMINPVSMIPPFGQQPYGPPTPPGYGAGVGTIRVQYPNGTIADIPANQPLPPGVTVLPTNPYGGAALTTSPTTTTTTTQGNTGSIVNQISSLNTSGRTNSTSTRTGSTSSSLSAPNPNGGSGARGSLINF